MVRFELRSAQNDSNHIIEAHGPLFIQAVYIYIYIYIYTYFNFLTSSNEVNVIIILMPGTRRPEVVSGR